MWQHFWQNKITCSSVFLLGLVGRAWAILQSPQSYDMGTFHAWGNHVWEFGLFATYQNVWSDYLPLPMLIFGAVSGLTQHIPLAYPDLFRIFWLIIEGSLIYRIYLHHSGTRHLPLVALLWLFPPFLMNTGWWGQIDSIPALLTVLSVLKLSSGKKLLPAALYALAVAIKPIMLVAGPVFLVLGYHKKALPHLLVTGILTLTLSGLPAVLPSLQELSPSTFFASFNFVFDQSTYQASMYPGTSINAWNLWSIQGTFWARDDISVLGVTAQQLGYVLFAICAFTILGKWRRDNWDPKKSLWVAGLLLLSFYTFTTRMHERHLMFALPFLIIASQTVTTRILTSLLSLIYVLNLWGALYWVNNAQTWPFSQLVMAIFSWAIILITLFLVFRPKLKLRSHLPEIILITFALTLRLISLSHPQTMVFDEVYHSFTAKEYLHNNTAAWEWWTTPPEGFAYEWTHPPLAKYGMVLGMLLFGENSFGWRIGSVIMGVVSLIGLSILGKHLTGSLLVARLVLFLGAIEGLHLVQSRIGMNDTYMLGCYVWSLVVATRGSWKKAAILYGLALASKWSALYGIIPLALLYLQSHSFKFAPLVLFKHFLFVSRLLFVAAIVYLLSFIPFLVSGHTTTQLVELHRQMWHYHTGLIATHNYQSTPLEWVAVARPVWYWVSYGEGVRSNIYAQGNPLLLWFGLFAFVIALATSWRKHWFTLVLVLIFTVPWIFSPRIMFFYHYLPTATFLMIPTSLILTHLSPRFRYTLLCLFTLSFILVSPFYYGYPVSNTYWELIFKLFPTWK